MIPCAKTQLPVAQDKIPVITWLVTISSLIFTHPEYCSDEHFQHCHGCLTSFPHQHFSVLLSSSLFVPWWWHHLGIYYCLCRVTAFPKMFYPSPLTKAHFKAHCSQCHFRKWVDFIVYVFILVKYKWKMVKNVAGK